MPLFVVTMPLLVARKIICKDAPAEEINCKLLHSGIDLILLKEKKSNSFKISMNIYLDIINVKMTKHIGIHQILLKRLQSMKPKEIISRAMANLLPSVISAIGNVKKIKHTFLETRRTANHFSP
ncbi:hypothetical protein RF11_10973 [Thelohanellus kitauei]|uniref:Uncharacterized protein n=1 Tax=Thelohanellus kitauei TaxID=669202 RepID=A0A0C2J0U2_THEKT|nr:hypothetical protein RF11_10973 [Thelohanellus kitauei]